MLLREAFSAGSRASAATFEAPAAVAGLDDVAMVSNAVEQRSGRLGVAEDGRPLAKGEARVTIMKVRS